MRGGLGFVSRGRGAGVRGSRGAARPAVGVRGGRADQAGGRRVLARPPQGSAAPRAAGGGFVWVVISGPSWEPLMIRKSNKQGNPVFHTQPWARPERLCVSSSPPHGLLSHAGTVDGGKFPCIHPRRLVLRSWSSWGGSTSPPGRFRRQRSSAARMEGLGWGLGPPWGVRRSGENPAGPVPRGAGAGKGGWGVSEVLPLRGQDAVTLVPMFRPSDRTERGRATWTYLGLEGTQRQE